MPRPEIYQGNSGGVIFYNIDAAVGRNCPNKHDDALLCQFFIKAADDYMQKKYGGKPQGLLVNGQWDHRWNNSLEAVLSTIQTSWGNKVVRDGRIDPVPYNQVRGRVHNAQYTMIFLNLLFDLARPGELPKLAELNDCPSELRKPLAVKFITS